VIKTKRWFAPPAGLCSREPDSRQGVDGCSALRDLERAIALRAFVRSTQQRKQAAARYSSDDVATAIRIARGARTLNPRKDCHDVAILQDKKQSSRREQNNDSQMNPAHGTLPAHQYGPEQAHYGI
jgi:hypothetical protein